MSCIVNKRSDDEMVWYGVVWYECYEITRTH